MSSVIEKNDGKKLVNLKLYVRYMVSSRCKMLVEAELNKLEIKYTISPFGGIEFLDEVTQNKLDMLRGNLQKNGLYLLDVQKSKLIDRIIITIVEVIHHFEELPKVNYSEIINEKLGLMNQPILKTFSDVMGMSIVQFIVIQKIERVKSHLIYDDMSLSEITNILNYKNEQFLIAQFKKITGLTPSHFEELKKERSRIISQNLKKSNGKRSSSLNQ